MVSVWLNFGREKFPVIKPFVWFLSIWEHKVAWCDPEHSGPLVSTWFSLSLMRTQCAEVTCLSSLVLILYFPCPSRGSHSSLSWRGPGLMWGYQWVLSCLVTVSLLCYECCPGTADIVVHRQWWIVVPHSILPVAYSIWSPSWFFKSCYHKALWSSIFYWIY